jgi:[lysine-biosynthesis-protein LysW]--L-2-aminoadipate ligase
VCTRLYATPWRTSLAYEKNRRPGALVTHGTVYPRIHPPSPALGALTQRMVAAVSGGLMGVDVLTDAVGRHWALEANAPSGSTSPTRGSDGSWRPQRWRWPTGVGGSAA